MHSAKRNVGTFEMIIAKVLALVAFFVGSGFVALLPFWLSSKARWRGPR